MTKFDNDFFYISACKTCNNSCYVGMHIHTCNLSIDLESPVTDTVTTVPVIWSEQLRQCITRSFSS